MLRYSIISSNNTHFTNQNICIPHNKMAVCTQLGICPQFSRNFPAGHLTTRLSNLKMFYNKKYSLFFDVCAAWQLCHELW